MANSQNPQNLTAPKNFQESHQAYEARKAHAITTFQQVKLKKDVSLKPKFTTHFFRKRKKSNPFDLRSFCNVLEVNTQEKYVEVEGLTTFYHIADATLKYGYMPAVVPEMRNITIGGTISGLGVEATSFKNGLVHENVLEMEVLTGRGEVITASADQHRDLFVTVPNALGTLGYVLKCKMKIIPVQKYVQVDLERYKTAEELFQAMKEHAKAAKVDFIEGLIFDPEHFVLVLGHFVNEIPAGERLVDIYAQAWYLHVRDRRVQTTYLTIKNFLWRWDPDAYWATVQPGVVGWALNTPALRKTILKPILRSDRLIKFGHTIQFTPWLKRLVMMCTPRTEQIIQDAGLNIDRCVEFFTWYKETIQIYPVWLCPVKVAEGDTIYPLYKRRGSFVVDVGFYSSKKLEKHMPDNYYNRLIEKKLEEMKGMKGLYSMSFYTKKEFWADYDEKSYLAAKNAYDPENVFPNVYEKVAGKVTK